MSVVGSRQKGRLFIEGREVPFVSAVITAQEGAPTTATIELVPLQGIKNIRPRTQVHVFLQDTKNFPDDDFYEVFEGEVLGRSYGKAQNARHMSVVAVDYSSYWDETKAFVMNPNFVVGKIADVIGGKEAPIDETAKALGGITFETSATANTQMIDLILAKQADGKPGNKDLALGVVAVINKLSSVSQFFSAAYERLRISDRLNLFSGGKVQEFLKDMEIDEFLRDYTGKFGGISDLRDMLYSVMALVFHTFISIPFPASLPLKSDKSKKGISQFLFVPDCYTLPAPLCNVLFPNQQISYDFDEDFRASPTRYMFRASMPIMGNQGIDYPQYPTQFFPASFSDYMFKPPTPTATASEKEGLLGPSKLLNDPAKPGRTYASIFYGNASDTGVGTSFSTVLRDADYMSNDESLKGIYLAMDTFMPSYTALIQKSSPAARVAFIQSIGSYMFFKKRFASRAARAQIIFNPFLVPGFNAIFLDESTAGQSFIAKLKSVSHIIQNDSCMTQVALENGRDFDEIDALSGNLGEPPTPAWFDPNVFGIAGTQTFNGKTALKYFQEETDYLFRLGAITEAEKVIRNKVTNPTAFPNLNQFFQATIGANATTNYNAQEGLDPKKIPPLPKLVSTRGAVSWLLFQYSKVALTPDARDAKVRELTSRPLVNIIDAFKFIRAQPVGYNTSGKFNLPDEFAAFQAVQTGDLPGRFDGAGGDKTYADKNAIAKRREIIDPYVQLLKTQRGFRG